MSLGNIFLLGFAIGGGGIGGYFVVELIANWVLAVRGSRDAVLPSQVVKGATERVGWIALLVVLVTPFLILLVSDTSCLLK